jgi:hypothetical protein
LLVAGAADGAAESAGAAEVALLGEDAGGVLSAHATTAPIAAKDRRSATIARFFMFLFS